MQEDSQTAQDIFHRNSHCNPFQLKLPSHYAKHESILLMAQAFSLNKLALLPFYQSEGLIGLYKLALEALLSQKEEVMRREEFLEGLVWHLENWQINMGGLGSWQYTRAAFFSLEERMKRNVSSMEKVILRRAIHEPNKQQFVNKSQNMQFKSDDLKFALNFCRKENEAVEQEEEHYDLPQDLLLVDDDRAWEKALTLHAQARIQIEVLGDYLRSYDNRGVKAYLKKQLGKRRNKQILTGLKLRQSLYNKVIENRNSNISKAIKVLEIKQTANK